MSQNPPEPNGRPEDAQPSGQPPVPPSEPSDQPFAPPPADGGYGQTPPPPAGGYGQTPPPPAGGYGQTPPPPAGGYGQTPPPPPAGGPGQEPGGYGAASGGYGQTPPPPPPPPGDGYGQAPPPPSAYPSPEQGGFPQAPPPGPAGYGQYGAPGPGYGAPGYGAPGGAQPFSVGAAIGYGWNSFKHHVGGFLGWTIIISLVALLLNLLINPTFDYEFGDTTGSGGMGVPEYTVVGSLLSGLSNLVALLLSVVLYQGAVHKVNGRLTGFGDFLKFDHAGPGFLTALLLGAAYVVGALIPFVGGLLTLVVVVLGTFAIPIALDTGASPIEAYRRSVQLVTGNVGSVLLLLLASVGVVLLGLLALCVGVFVATPIVTIASVFAYKALSQQPVAPA